MSTAASALIPPDEPVFRLLVAQYHQMVESGTLSADDPVELVEGILLYKMPSKSPHTTVVRRCRKVIDAVLSQLFFYITEQPVTLADGEPEPDSAIIRGGIDDFASGHPEAKDIALVIEVADSSLDRDRGIKLRSYNNHTTIWCKTL